MRKQSSNKQDLQPSPKKDENQREDEGSEEDFQSLLPLPEHDRSLLPQKKETIRDSDKSSKNKLLKNENLKIQEPVDNNPKARKAGKLMPRQNEPGEKKKQFEMEIEEPNINSFTISGKPIPRTPNVFEESDHEAERRGHDNNQNFDLKKELIKLLNKYKINSQQEVEECLVLFETNIDDFKNIPERKDRKSFAKEVEELIQRQKQSEETVKKGFDMKKELTKLLNKYKIVDEEDIKECLNLFETDIQELKNCPERKFREPFAKQLDELINKQKQLDRPPNFDFKSEFLGVLKKYQITEKQDIEQCLQLLQSNVNELKKFPERKHRIPFAKDLDELIKKKQSQEKEMIQEFDFNKELIKLLNKFKINSQQEVEECLRLFESDLNQLKNVPERKLRKPFAEELDQLIQKKKQLEKQMIEEFDFKKEFIKLLNKYNITEEQDIKDCLKFVESDLNELKKFPERRLRGPFAKELDELIKKKDEMKMPSVQEFNIKKELTRLLNKYQITKEQDIKECLELFQSNVDELKNFPQRKHRKPFAKELDELIEKQKALQGKQDEEFDVKKELISLLKKYHITEEEDVNECLELFETNIQELKKQPDRNLRIPFAQELDELIKKQNTLQRIMQVQEENLDELQELTKILLKCGISEETFINQCKDLFQQKQFKELKQYPDRKYRKTFGEMIDHLLARIQNCHKEFDPVKQLIKILRKVEIAGEDDLKECLDMFQKKDYKSLKNYPDRKYKKEFGQELDKLLKKIEENSKIDIGSLPKLLAQCQLSQENFNNIFQSVKQKNFTGFLDLPENSRKMLIQYFQKQQVELKSRSMETQIRLSLCPYLTDSEIQSMVKMIARKKLDKEELKNPVLGLIEEIEKEFQIEIEVTYNQTKKKIIKFNELILHHDKVFLQSQISKLVGVEFENTLILLEGEQIKLEELVFTAKQLYHIEIFCLKQYNCVYKGKTHKIGLLPEKPLLFNKGLIMEELFKNDLIYDEKEPFNLNNVSLEFETKIKILSEEDYADYSSLIELQKVKGQISTIQIEVMLEVTLYYEDIMQLMTLSSNTTMKMLKTTIDEKYVPFQSQIVFLIVKEEKILIKQQEDNQYISIISPKYSIVFQLSNKQSTQFYGFHKNVPLSFQTFSSCFIQNQEQIEATIQGCSFVNNQTREEENFIEQFFQSLYSGIKKRFPIQTIIDKYRYLVSKIKCQQLWIPQSNSKGIRINESFVVVYAFYNADQRLKIQIMNLLKENIALPLYYKQFQNIFKVQNKLNINKELLWILPKAYTITSIGLHTEGNIANEKGKSYLLNEIFPTHFQESENKQGITQGIPFIAVRVFHNIFPLNIIDIPHDCPQEISEEILKSSNLVLIHSWRTEEQTQQELQNLKRNLNHIPYICLLRDNKQGNNMKNLKEKRSIINGEIQKISNFSDKKRSVAEINLLKEEIFKFIKEKMINNKDITAIFKLFKENNLFYELTRIVSKLQKKILDLTPIGRLMIEMKKQTDDDKIREMREVIKTKLSPEIEEILLFLISDKIKPIQSMALSLLREKIRTYQSQKNLELIKIYQLRDQFKIISEISNPLQKQKKIQELNVYLQTFTSLQPEDIINREDKDIFSIIAKMADKYENEIKPKIFSFELFWRQLNYLIGIDENITIQNHKILNIMKQLKEIEISNNLPFEIIDGDLLEIPRKLMKQIFQLRDDRAIVLTIMGPQSSGKSTLLNFLFGCDFATSQGRCTRGVYGTFFRFSQNRGRLTQFSNCDGIFVIDTEGLFAITNQEDKQNEDRRDFDSKLVLFCLAVSDIVVVNVRGNFDLNTEKIVRLCHERLEELNIEEEKRPELAVVLNQNASSRQEQSENEFKQIKKSIKFDISKSLTLAYKIVNYGQEQISLFEKNQILTKKYPQEAFLKETTSLMNSILKVIAKKRGISTLADIIQKFEKIWSMVVSFPNLSKSVTKQYLKLETSIKEWIDNHEQEQKESLGKMYQDYRYNKLTEQKILEEIEDNHKKILQLFEQQFKEKFSDEDQIKFLKRHEKQKMRSKFMVILANVKYELESIKLEKRVRLSAIEGDWVIKEKAKEIYQDGKEHTEEELQNIFNKTFDEQLQKIEATTNLGEEILRQYESISKNYEFLIRDKTGSAMGLPKQKYWIGDEKCLVEDFLPIIRNKILEPYEVRYDSVFQYTNKVHTNILKGGRTDASLEYFNMKDYFHESQILEVYGFNTYELSRLLNREAILSKISFYIEEAKKKKGYLLKLKQIWKEINSSLQKINLRFINENNFIQLYENNKSSVFSFFYHVVANPKIQYQFLQKRDEQFKQSKHHQQSTRKNYHLSQSSHFIVNKKSPDQSNVPDKKKKEGCKCEFSKYLFNRVVESEYPRCLCSYSKTESKDYLMKKFYAHINWNEIIKEIEQSEKFTSFKTNVNKQISDIINKDLEVLNIQINPYFDWLGYSKNSNYAYVQGLTFKCLRDPIEVSSKENINAIIESPLYILTRDLKNKLIRKVYGQSQYHSDFFLPLFMIKTKKLEPSSRTSYLDAYLRENTSLTVHELKQPKCKVFLFQEIKHRKKSLDKFFYNIFNIVKTTIDSWKSVNKKTLVEIYNRVSQEISKFNNDLNQLSCNLSETYLGYVNLAVVYMIWKLIIDQKIKEKRQIYDAKLKEREKEWESFKARTSKDEDKNVSGDIGQFFKQMMILIGEEVTKKKEEIMKIEKDEFARSNTRDGIQSLLDMEIFNSKTSETDVLKYLQSQYDAIMNKYKECYELSWEKGFKGKYASEKVARDLFQQFYDLVVVFDNFLSDNGVDQSKTTISDFFRITETDNKMHQIEVAQDQYRQEGKKVLFEYFIDTLISEGPTKKRKCTKVTVEPIYPFKIEMKMSITLRRILLEIKAIKYFSMTNLPKFIKQILKPEIKNKILNDLEENSKPNDKDKTEFINLIKVVVCNEKCPCCGRICGIQNQHQYHQCLYGHQMRGLNGNYIEKENDVKEASVIRCEQMAQTDLMKYNGTQYTWTQFKAYWKAKSHGGWIYDDANLNNNTNQLRFEKAWTIAGPIYCKNNNIKYVDFNDSKKQKIAINAGKVNGKFHFILALDQSGSMSGHWSNLMNSVKQTVQKINQLDGGNNNLKISIIKFESNAILFHENILPSQVNTNIPFRGGGTNFDHPFNMAASLATKYIQEATISFIFMTDGCAGYPTQGIQTLKRLQASYPNKLIYYGIEFGGKQQVMTTMASELKGKSGVAYNPQELTNNFIKGVVEVIQFKQKN